MSFQHVDLVLYAKSYGLLYLLSIFIGVVVYACWPSNKDKFNDAANSVLDDEDTPCQ